MNMRQDSRRIIEAAIHAAQPDTAVKKALANLPSYTGRLVLISIGKAAWQMAYAAHLELGSRISSGLVITKYGHAKGAIGSFSIHEAGHPVPDANSYAATQEAIRLVSGLSAEDLVLFLISGGGSALFESPLVSPEELEDVTGQMLACGASITEINTIRKHLSAVKGGKFAQLCAPTQIYSVILSDILGDPLDMIASGPAYPDASTCEQAQAIVRAYGLKLSEKAMSLMQTETPKALDNVTTFVTGSVRQLCRSAARACRELGYETFFLTASLCCEAREAGAFLASIARDHQDTQKSLAFVCGGETVVHLTGKGLGGRNQEIALSAAQGLAGCTDTCLFSIGSDGTDGPTDAAGGIVDEHTLERLNAAGLDVRNVLANNDAYHALQAAGSLLQTGPTGTNVNDLTVLLIRRP